MIGMVKALFDAVCGSGGTVSASRTFEATPMPKVKTPKCDEEWLTVKKSGISHRFAIVPQMNQYYRYSACGFETTADKVERSSGRRCVKCERSKGF